MPLQVKIKSPEGGTLKTANTYIEDDINIVPNLQNKTITQNGTVTADEGYAGLSEVIVNVKTEQHNSPYSTAKAVINSFASTAGLPSASFILSE